MMGDADLESVTTWIGSGVPRFYLPLNQIFPQSNVSQVILLAKDLAARERIRGRLAGLLAAEFGEARTRVKVLPNGPPVDYPVMFPGSWWPDLALGATGRRTGQGTAAQAPSMPRCQ